MPARHAPSLHFYLQRFEIANNCKKVGFRGCSTVQHEWKHPSPTLRWAGKVPRQRNRGHSSCRYGWAPGGSGVLVPACCVCDDASGARDRRRSRRTRGALNGCLPRAVRPKRATPRATQRSAPPAMRARATLSSSCSARDARRTSSTRMPSAPRLSGVPPRRAQFHVACAGVAASAC
jgi:hypothetical protein